MGGVLASGRCCRLIKTPDWVSGSTHRLRTKHDATDALVAVEHIVIVVRPGDARLLTSPLF
jgi:hypothetical protein